MLARIVMLALAVFVFAGPQAALAQTIAETASRWGLVGTWKLDCSKPTTRNNAALKYAIRDGKLFHDRDFGDTKDSSQVMSAATKADGSIEILISFASLSQTRQFSMIKGKDGRIRATVNRDVNTNQYTVKDGKLVANGNETPWQTRCGGQTAALLP